MTPGDMRNIEVRVSHSVGGETAYVKAHWGTWESSQHIVPAGIFGISEWSLRRAAQKATSELNLMYRFRFCVQPRPVFSGEEQ